MRDRVFFKQDVCGVSGMPIRFVVFDSFESELDHFGCNEELLKDGSLFSIFREDEELSEKLESSEVL